MEKRGIRHMVKATNQQRALYDQLVAKYRTHANAGSIIITDSYLYLMKSLQGTITTLQFDVLTNQGTPQVNEVRLSLTDRFCVRDWSIMVMKAGASVAATAAEISVAVPSTYPNPAVFTGSNEAANLQSVYNGNMRIVIDSTVFFQAFPNRNFYRVPVSQLGTTSAAIAGPVQYKIAADGWDSMNYSYSPVYPTFEFNGIGKNEATLTLPNPTLTSGTSSQNFAVAIFRGYLIQNVNQPR